MFTVVVDTYKLFTYYHNVFNNGRSNIFLNIFHCIESCKHSGIWNQIPRTDKPSSDFRDFQISSTKVLKQLLKTDFNFRYSNQCQFSLGSYLSLSRTSQAGSKCVEYSFTRVLRFEVLLINVICML